MPRQTRHSTDFKGVYFVELANEKKSFFIRYKHNGKSVEERAGRSNEGWNAEKAWRLRAERVSGIESQPVDLNSGSDMNAGQFWTFSIIFEKYLRLRPDLKGRENDIYRFKNYLEMDFADRTPEQVTHDDVERFRHNLQNKGLKPATVRHVLELLRRLANFAAKKNYSRGLNFKIEMPKVENQKTEVLSQDQIEKLLQVLQEEPDLQVSNLVRMALYTGMRRGELFELCWNDIDFYDKKITVRSGKKSQYPTIPMNEMAEKVLAEHVHVVGSSKFVFPGRGGKKRTECKRPLLRIRKKAGLPEDFRLLQGLRHVYASILVSSGKVDLETLQSLLTQKSILMTQRYAHLLDQSEDFKEGEISLLNETVTDSTDSESNKGVGDTFQATAKTDIDERAEDANDVITSDNIENEIVRCSADSESNKGVPKPVLSMENQESETSTNFTDIDISAGSMESVETPEAVMSNDYRVKTKREIFTDNLEKTDIELVSEVQKIVDAKYYMDSAQQEEISATVSKIKMPELSQLVKQNFFAIKPTDGSQSEVFSQKNIVEKNKLEERIQEKNRPTLKDLKNDLKSLSQLVHSAPRKSKFPVPKRKQS